MTANSPITTLTTNCQANGSVVNSSTIISNRKNTAPSQILATQLISRLLTHVQSGALPFAGVITFIDTHYNFIPTTFNNGSQVNALNHNNGSAKVLYFAQLHHLSVINTLHLFAEHYQSVVANPAGTDHQNIRQFNYYGWPGVCFSAPCLTRKD